MRLVNRTIILCTALWLAACAGLPTQTARPAASAQPTAASPLAPTPLPENAHGLSAALRMTTGRASHTATLLPDGTILIAGGFREEGTSEIAIASAEIYDPATNSFAPAGDLKQARSGHTATLLPNGLVLIAGGWGPTSRLGSAELYDPANGQFESTDDLSAPRAGMTATLLPDGRVLIAGGETARNSPSLTAEVYDPATSQFANSGALNTGRSAHSATLLVDGRVLLAGGNSNAATVLDSAELYDPNTGVFTLTGGLGAVRYKHAAARLADARVLVVGGSDARDWSGQYASAELYNPASGAFAPVPGPKSKRFKLSDAILLLGDGSVLIGGGSRDLELFDAAGQRFVPSGMLDTAYYYSVLTPLSNNRVLITGGYDGNIQPSDKAWIYSY